MGVGKNSRVAFCLAVFVLLCWSGPARASVECPFCRVAKESHWVIEPAKPAVRGQNVELLQQMLKQINCYRGPVNGVYDSATIEAVKEFQVQRGIEPDGVAEEITWQALDEEYCLLAGKEVAPAPEGQVSILIDTKQRKLWVLSDGEPYKQYPVAVGKYDTPTPIGDFKVLRRARNWGTGFGTRWIGLTVPWGVYGIHGTNKPYAIGGYASHGCVRMNNRSVEEVYPWVKPGTRVVITGNPFKYKSAQFGLMRRGSRGGDVMEVQLRLQRLGFYTGPIDGIWGGGMERAVVEFRHSKGLRRDNAVDDEVYRLLGL